MFDCVVALSVFEHIRNIEKAVKETARVLKENGVLLVGFPIENIMSNFILDIVKIVIGFDRKVHHPSNHSQILNCLEKTLVNEKSIYYPFNGFKYSSLFYCGVWKKNHGKR
jgi:ubiquinone/menaquinone biosynthesis C-methylase UbiE